MAKAYKSVFGAILAILLLPSFAFAAGGLDKVNSLMSVVSTALYAVGVVVLTIAIMWAGFKIMFQGQTLREVAPPLLGGILVGAASGIAGLLIS
ncbi:conjugal transfer protein TraC [Helicobacter sp. CLO-3]|uniref:TrbC/VirB2 family protein n=1 Tax=unclassified Helicobacter TaxID=2593540 RepID=UPI000804BC2D|nr:MULTISPECIES: TrbC/VirB2 family protein [unclassified Helicobacter]OBV30140.1 conjugal transfer protein TraC [Helicobacter sp. CLO-3]OHU83516.1 conjugal transfer protein TraC [Helicobacter sp. CLO-3]